MSIVNSSNTFHMSIFNMFSGIRPQAERADCLLEAEIGNV